MDLRNLAFKVEFEGSAAPVLKMDGATNDLKKSVSGATGELEGMGKTLKNDVKTENIDKLDKATEKLGKTTENAAKKSNYSIDSMQKKLKSLEKTSGSVGKKLMLGVTTPVVGLATAGTKMFLDLDNSIRKVTTLADSDILPVAKIRKEIREISDASGLAQTEIAESIYDSLSADVSSSNVMEFVRSGINLTRAGFTDMETVIDATTTVLNAYGDKAYGISKIHDIFVQTQDKGKISVDELGKSLGRVIPTASSLGVNLDQLGAGYAILTAKGQNAELATTNLNAMLGELGTTGSKSDKALRQVSKKSFAQLTKEGKTVGEVLALVDGYAQKNKLSLKDMFGSMNAGSGAVTLLSEGVEGYNNMLGEMNGATGKTAANAAIMEDGWLKIQRATNLTKNALIDAGAVIAPYVEVGAQKVSELVEEFNALDEGSKSNIMGFIGLAAATGPVIFGISKVAGFISLVLPLGAKLVSGVGLVTAFLGKSAFAFSAVAGGAATLGEGLLFIMGPVGWVIAGFAALVAAGVAVYKNFDKIKEGWNKLINVFKKPAKGTVDITTKNGATSSRTTKVDGSHSSGLGRVPFNNYKANLHKDEEVLRADDPRNQNNPPPKPQPRSGGILFNPIYNIEISGTATENDKQEIEKVIDRKTRELFNVFFREMGMKMA